METLEQTNQLTIFDLEGAIKNGLVETVPNQYRKIEPGGTFCIPDGSKYTAFKVFPDGRTQPRINLKRVLKPGSYVLISNLKQPDSFKFRCKIMEGGRAKIGIINLEGTPYRLIEFEYLSTDEKLHENGFHYAWLDRIR